MSISIRENLHSCQELKNRILESRDAVMDEEGYSSRAAFLECAANHLYNVEMSLQNALSQYQVVRIPRDVDDEAFRFEDGVAGALPPGQGAE